MTPTNCFVMFLNFLGKRKNRKQVNANNVLTFLIDNNHINVKTYLDGSYDSQDFKDALR